MCSESDRAAPAEADNASANAPIQSSTRPSLKSVKLATYKRAEAARTTLTGGTNKGVRARRRRMT